MTIPDVIQPGAGGVVVGRALAEWRRSHGHTQASLAAAIGRSRRIVQYWEAGRVLPGYIRAALAAVSPRSPGGGEP